jgi:glycosyltransferase involved in cell wall biosynthesis
MPDSGEPARVTVVVPTHNSGAPLTQAIESILAQDYADWEAVIVDDASTDDTHEVALAFARRDPRINAIRLKRNVGVAAARNVAIEACGGGELIALLDHDDHWRHDYLERSVAAYDEAAARGRRVGIVASDALIETPDGISGETYADRFGWIEEIDYDAMIRRNCICARALFARAAYDEVGGFSSDCPGYDDYDLWLRMLEAGYEVATVREPLAVYRVHPGAMSADQLLMAKGAIAAHRRALARGAIDRRRRRAVRARIRHHRALRERALARRAAADGHHLAALGRALKAAPYGLVAFLQVPSRWGEWLADAFGRRPRSPAGP